MAQSVREQLAEVLATASGLEVTTLEPLLEIPPQPELGDYALPCFKLSKTLRQAPPAIAAQLASRLSEGIEGFSRIEQTGGYLNFFLDRPAYIRQQVQTLLADPDQVYPQIAQGDETVLVEFSSPNIAKPFHVGHAFTTILGQALANFYERAGYRVKRLNHLGDYGTQFGKLIVAYERWGDEAALQREPIQELLRIYVKFHQEAKQDEALETKAREAFKRLEEGQPHERALWQRFRDLSLVEFERVYQRLGIHFDSYQGESFYSDQIPAVVEMLREKQLLVESQGAQVVDLESAGLPPCIVLKSDGTTIYASRDLAAILYREKTWHFYKNLYVVGIPQALHFRQVFEVLKRAGYDCANRCEHVGFGLVKFPEGKMSTRAGDVIFLEDLLSEAVAKTRAIIDANAQTRETQMSQAEREAIAERVGLGAVIYTFLRNGRERDIVFSWEDMLNFDGDTAPYLQYTYARARSILRRNPRANEDQQTQQAAWIEALQQAPLDHPTEFALIRQIRALETAFYQVLKTNEPSILAKQLSHLAHLFNKFYTECPILKAQSPVLEARLALCQVASEALKQGLALLGIQVVERM